jgi:hypothetical protein
MSTRTSARLAGENASAPKTISDDAESTRMDVDDQESATHNEDYAMGGSEESEESSSDDSFSDSLNQFQHDHKGKSKQVRKGANVRSVETATS